jgi:hypothetical protein
MLCIIEHVRCGNSRGTRRRPLDSICQKLKKTTRDQSSDGGEPATGDSPLTHQSLLIRVAPS